MFGYGMRDFRIFEIQVSVEFRVTMRDEDGWVEGCAPSDNKWHKPETRTYRVIARREAQARESVEDHYRSSMSRNFEVTGVVSHPIHAMILEVQP